MALGQGIAEGFNTFMQNKTRNTALQKQNEALIKAFMVDEETKKYAPEGLDKFIDKSISGGGLSLKDNIALNGMLNTTLATKREIQEQNLKAQEGAMMKQRLQASAEMMKQQERDTTALAAALKQFMPPGEGEEQLKFDPARFLQIYAQGGGSPNSIEKVDAVLRMMGPQKPQQQDIRFSSLEELHSKYPSEKWDYTIIPQNDGSVVVPGGKLNPRAPAQPQPQIPNPLVDSMYKDISKERADSVMPALSSLRAYDEIDRILNSESGKIISGKFANPELFFKQAANAIGAKNADVQNTETLRSLFAVPVAQIIKNFGSGTGLSDADREFAAKAAGGDITLSEGTIKELVRIGKQASENIRSNYEERLDSTFPENSDNESFKQARRALGLPKAGKASKEAAVAPSKVEAAPEDTGARTTLDQKRARLAEIEAELNREKASK